MRKFARGGTLLYGLTLLAVAALAVTGAASGNHWADYTGNADRHELQQGDPPLCPATAGGISFRVDAGDLSDGGEYPSGNPLVKVTGIDKDGGTLSWALLPAALDLYDVDAVVMKGGPDAMVYFYDAGAGGYDDSDTGITTPIDESAQPRTPYAIDHVDFCFDPKGGTGVKRLEVTKTATTSWEKVYTWDVEKSADPTQLTMKKGDSGTVNWKVDVNQTGFNARNAVVSGTITVSNPNGVDVTGVSVVDALPGAVVDCDNTAGEPYTSSGLTVPADGNVQCTYTAARSSSDGGTNVATASGAIDGVDVSDSGSADFAFGAPTAEVNKTVKAVDGKTTWNDIDGTTSFTYAERFTCSSTGRTNVVNLLGDNPSTPQVETNYVLDTDSATVTVSCSSNPPPPDVCPNLEGNQTTVPPGMVKDAHGNCVTPPGPPSDEHMDIQVSKTATPQVQLVNGQATIAYTVRVRNSDTAPNQAHNVTVADAAPSGVTFLAVTQQPAGGNCTISSSLLSCTLGTLGPGVESVIGISATVTQTGTYSNCATATGDGKDTNGANNVACASTLVTAPVTPPVAPPTPKPKPKPKPHPKPQPELCRVLKVTPGMVKANGKRHVVTAKVTKSRTPAKGVKVRFKATGVNKVVKTNSHGVARISVKPGKAGILVVRITNVKACNSARVGVVGVFEPPVTG